MNTTQETEKTVAPLMVSNVPIISENKKVADIEDLLIRETKNFETIDYVYVVDGSGYLVGAVSLKEIFRSDKQAPVSSFLTGKLVSVRPNTHRERASRLAFEHGLKAIPVVDKDNKFLGVIPNDSIRHILVSEGIEDILKLGGVGYKSSLDDITTLSWQTSLKHRLPWLILGLFGGIMSAGIVGFFDEVLSENIILAAFIPLIAYMANAVGTQMEVFIIRDFALNPKFNFIKYFTKQASIVFLIGLVVSILLFAVNLAMNRDLMVSLVLGIALFVAVITSLVSGLVIPFIFGKMKMDPANASGPIANIIQDVISVFVYFYVASLIL